MLEPRGSLLSVRTEASQSVLQHGNRKATYVNLDSVSPWRSRRLQSRRKLCSYDSATEGGPKNGLRSESVVSEGRIGARNGSLQRFLLLEEQGRRKRAGDANTGRLDSARSGARFSFGKLQT